MQSELPYNFDAQPIFGMKNEFSPIQVIFSPIIENRSVNYYFIIGLKIYLTEIKIKYLFHSLIHWNEMY